MKKKLAAITLILLALNSIWAFDMLVIEYCKTVNNIKDEEFYGLKKELQKIILKLTKGNISEPMLDFATNNWEYLPALRSSKKLADELSAKICGVEGEPRHTDDEVDAVRHFIWVSLMTFKMGKKDAQTVTHLQEYRGTAVEHGLNSSGLMDLYNNQLALEYGKELRDWNFAHFYTKKIQNQIIEEAFSKLDAGEFKILKTQKSKCARPELYPNFQ